MTDDAAIPAHIGRLIDFVNTYDFEDNSDQISDPTSLSRWLTDHDLLVDEPTIVSVADLDQARELRDALRAAMSEHHELTTVASRALDRVVSQLPLRLSFAGSKPTLVPIGTGVPAALGALIVSISQAAVDGSWPRLKICPSDTCRWAFYDVSKNRSRTWCSMESCGNRAKTRRYRSRRKAAGASPS